MTVPCVCVCVLQVHNVSFAFELMQDAGLQKPKARPEGEASVTRLLLALLTWPTPPQSSGTMEMVLWMIVVVVVVVMMKAVVVVMVEVVVVVNLGVRLARTSLLGVASKPDWVLPEWVRPVPILSLCVCVCVFMTLFLPPRPFPVPPPPTSVFPKGQKRCGGGGGGILVGRERWVE